MLVQNTEDVDSILPFFFFNFNFNFLFFIFILFERFGSRLRELSLASCSSSYRKDVGPSVMCYAWKNNQFGIHLFFFGKSWKYYKLQNTGRSTSYTKSRATNAHHIIIQRLQNNRGGKNKNCSQISRSRTQLC